MDKPPRLVPFTGLPPGVEPGPLGKRFLAQLIDLLVPGVIAGVFTVAIRSAEPGTVRMTLTLIGSLLVAVWFVVVWGRIALRAASPGMRLMNIQLVGLKDGRPIGWGRVLIRAIVLILLAATGIGLVLMVIFLASHARRQGWHDRLTKSVMIKERALAPGLPRVAAAVPRPIPPRATSEPRPQAGPQTVLEGVQKPSEPADPSRSQPAEPAGAATSTSGSSQPETAIIDAQAAERYPLNEGWLAVLDDGREIDVSGLVLLGRNPQPRPGEDDAVLIKVADETRTVSKTHLALDVDDNGMYVMDRGSTNGSTLTNTDGVSSYCSAGDVVPVADGNIVSFGDHWLEIRRST